MITGRVKTVVRRTRRRLLAVNRIAAELSRSGPHFVMMMVVGLGLAGEELIEDRRVMMELVASHATVHRRPCRGSFLLGRRGHAKDESGKP